MNCSQCYMAQDVRLRLCDWCGLAFCPRCIERHACTGKRQ